MTQFLIEVTNVENNEKRRAIVHAQTIYSALVKFANQRRVSGAQRVAVLASARLRMRRALIRAWTSRERLNCQN